jgi:hypothetical protein
MKYYFETACDVEYWKGRLRKNRERGIGEVQTLVLSEVNKSLFCVLKLALEGRRSRYVHVWKGGNRIETVWENPNV